MVKKACEDTKNIDLSDEDLIYALQDQVSLLTFYCKNYDAGQKNMALPMSSTLRNLFHTSKNKMGGLGCYRNYPF